MERISLVRNALLCEMWILYFVERSQKGPHQRLLFSPLRYVLVFVLCPTTNERDCHQRQAITVCPGCAGYARPIISE